MYKSYYEFITGEAFQSIVREEINNNDYTAITSNEILKSRESIALITKCLTIALQTLELEDSLKLYIKELISAIPILTSDGTPDDMEGNMINERDYLLNTNLDDLTIEDFKPLYSTNILDML